MMAGDVLRDIGTNAALILILVQAIKQVLPEAALRWVALGAILGAAALNVAIALIVGERVPETLVNAALVGVFGAGSAVGIYKAQEPAGLLKPKG